METNQRSPHGDQQSDRLEWYANVLDRAYPFDTRIQRVADSLRGEAGVSRSHEELQDQMWESIHGYDHTAGLRAFIAGMASTDTESVSPELVEWAAQTPGISNPGGSYDRKDGAA